MNLYEYVPFFGYLEQADEILGFVNYTHLRGKKERLSEIMELDNDIKFDIELSESQIFDLQNVDYSCFIKVLNSIEDNEKIVHATLKMILNSHEESGGYPIDVIHFILHDLTLNTHNYNIHQQTYIESFLTQSLVNYERNPYRKNRLTNPHFDPDDESSYELLCTFFLKQYNVDLLLQGLKKSFTIEKGKDISIIIEILKEYKILVIPDKKFSLFYNCLKEFFDRNIGSYASINDYKTIHEQDKNIIKVKIDDLLKRISKK